MDLSRLKARDVMKTDVIRVHPDTTLLELANLLREKRITGAPVVDRNNKLVGVVSHTDIVRAYALFPRNKMNVHPYFKGDEKTGPAPTAEEPAVEDFGHRKVEEIMTSETFAFHEDIPVTTIARNMMNLHMHRVIIVDEELNLSGIVTTMDMVALISELGPT